MTMTDRRSRRYRAGPSLAALFGVVLLLGGCSFWDNALMPSLTGEYGASSPPGDTLLLGGTDFSTPDIDDADTSHTPAGQKVRALRGDLLVLKDHIDLTNRVLQRLRGELLTAVEDYQERFGTLKDSLKGRTPPTAEELASQRRDAELALAQVAQSADQLSNLLKEASSNAAEAGAMTEATTLAVSALQAEGEDQEQLLTLQDEATRMAAVSYRLQTELSEDIVQSSDFVAEQRAALAALGPTSGQPQPAVGKPAPDEPLVVVRFDRPDSDPTAIVGEALRQALRSNPDAQVQLIAIAPEKGVTPSSAQRTREHLKKVLDSVIAAGVPADRIDLSARTSPDVTVDEVQVFVH